MRSAERPDAAGEQQARQAVGPFGVPMRLLIFLTFAFAYFFSYFYRSANAVIADDLARDLQLGPVQLGLMTSLFFMAFAAAQIPLGSALDRFGARFVTPALMLVGVVGSVMFGLAQSFAMLAVARALIGLGMAGVLMGSLKAFSGWFSPQQFATVSGLFVGVGSLGALAAATPMAVLNESVGWRMVFIGGAALLLASAAAIAWLGKPAPAAAAARSTAQQASVLEVFSSLTFWRIAFLSFTVAGSMFAIQGLWAGPYLVERVGLPTLATGNLLLLMGLGVSSGYIVIGWIADRFGLARTAAAAALGMLAVQVTLAFFPATAPPGLLAFLFLSFGFCGASNVLTFAHARRVFPLHMTGRAVTAVNLFGIGGSALLQWLLGVVISLFPANQFGAQPPQAYTAMFLVTAGLLATALMFYLPLARSSDV